MLVKLAHVFGVLAVGIKKYAIKGAELLDDILPSTVDQTDAGLISPPSRDRLRIYVWVCLDDRMGLRMPIGNLRVDDAHSKADVENIAALHDSIDFYNGTSQL